MTKVQLTKVDPKIRDQLNKFKADHNLECPDDRLGSLGEVIEHLLEDAQALRYAKVKIASLEAELRELKKQ